MNQNKKVSKLTACLLKQENFDTLQKEITLMFVLKFYYHIYYDWKSAKIVSISSRRGERGTITATARQALRIFDRLFWLEFLSDQPGVSAIS